MSMIEAFSSSFSSRPSSSYKAFLENRSHARYLAQRLDAGIAKLVVSNDAIRDGLVTSTSRLSAEVKAISSEVSLIRGDAWAIATGLVRSLTDIQFSIERGFGDTLRGLRLIGATLEDIHGALKTPETTWAYEQFEIASQLVQRRLYGDALERLRWAIEGRDGRTGYRYDSRFHLLQGTIQLGLTEGEDSEHIDLEKAKAALASAVHYAQHEALDLGERERAHLIACLSLQAWAYYCAGEMSESEACYRKALDYDQRHGKTWYLLAKVCLNSRRELDGVSAFTRAIELDPTFAIDAAMDDDFLPHRDALEEVVARYRRAMLERFFRDVQQATEVSRPEAITALTKALTLDADNAAQLEAAAQRMRDVTARGPTMPLSEILSMGHEVRGAAASLETAKLRALKVLEDKIEKTEQALKDVYPRNFDKTVLALILSASSGVSFVAMLLAPYTSHDPPSPDTTGYKVSVVVLVFLALLGPVLLLTGVRRERAAASHCVQECRSLIEVIRGKPRLET